MIKEIILFPILLLFPIFLGLESQYIIIWFLGSLFSYTTIQFLTYFFLKDKKKQNMIFLGFFIMYIISILNYKVSITIGTHTNPWIMGDAGPYYYLGEKLAKVNDLLSFSQKRGVKINDMGYPIFLGYLFKIFSIDLVWGQIANLFLGTLNILLIGIFTKEIFVKDKIVIRTMFLASLSPHLLATGTILLKDVFIIFSVLLVVIGAVKISKQKKLFSSLFVIFLGLFIIILFRWQYVFIYIFISIVIVSNKKIMLLPLGIVLSIFIIYSFSVGRSYTNMELSQKNIAKKSDFKSTGIRKGENSFVERLVGINVNRSVPQKIIRLPLFLIIQFLTPFYVWKTGHIYPYLYIEYNMNILWFLFIGPLIFLGLFYLFNKIDKKDFNRTIFKKIAFIGIILYTIPAYTHMGLVPRYAAFSLPFLLPFGGYLLSSINEKKVKDILIKFYLFYFLIGFLAILFYLIIKM